MRRMSESRPHDLGRRNVRVARVECGILAIITRLTTYVRVMHLRSCVLTHNTMCNLWHNSDVHIFAPRECENVYDVSCVRS